LASSQVTLEPTATPEQLSYDGQQMLNTLGPVYRMLMIGAALVAKGVGIAVAVPAVLVYNYFLRRLKLTAVDLDDFATTSTAWRRSIRSACCCTRCRASPAPLSSVRKLRRYPDMAFSYITLYKKCRRSASGSDGLPVRDAMTVGAG
jgi:hypothetical protein